MPATTPTPRYQEGCLARVRRAKGPDVWVYRWRETDEEGQRVQRKKVVGTVSHYPTMSAAKRAVENLRAEVNAQEENVDKMTVSQAWGHFQEHELRDPGIDRSESTIDRYLQVFQANILPRWKDVFLEDVKAVQVEKWLRSLDLANGTKAKIRNTMSALFSHCVRHEFYEKLNPIASVRQSATRAKEPEVLTLEELRGVITNIKSEPIKVMVVVAATTAMRRSEVCGLKWRDLEFEARWYRLKQGFVHQPQAVTSLKTEASRKGVPMNDDVAELLLEWRKHTPYPADSDWVFASPHDNGKLPYNPVPAMSYWIRPAAKVAGLKKHVKWHTFRHSVATLLGQNGEEVKVVQEILRHASSRITQDIYQQAAQTAKRKALTHFTGLFVVPETNTA